MHEYQKHSKLLLYRNNDATYPTHFHMHCEIIYILDGEVQVTVDGNTYVAHRDEAVFIAPHQIHSYSSTHLISIYVMFVSPLFLPEYSERFKDSVPASPVVHVGNAEDIRLCRELFGAMDSLYEKAREKGLEKGTTERDATALALAKAGVAILMDYTEWKEKTVSSPDTTREILDYCLNHYKTDLSIQSLAAALGISTYLVTRAFSKDFRCGFRQYINSLRIDDASKKLISGSEPITQIAFSVGFDTLRTFNRAFLAEKGVTPSEFRRRYGSGSEISAPQKSEDTEKNSELSKNS